jgi:hypothetical protein
MVSSRTTQCGDKGGGSVLSQRWSVLRLIRLRVSFLALGVLASAGCGQRGEKITVNWRKPKPQVTQGTPLRYKTIQIGQVEKVQPAESGDGTTVTIRVLPKYGHYVRAKSTFLVESPAGGHIAYIELIPLDRDGPPALPDAVFQGAESRIEARVERILTDWKRTTMIIALIAGVIVLLFVITRALFRLWALSLCLGSGVAGVLLGRDYLSTSLVPYLPPNVPANVVGMALAFLVGYVVGIILVSILLRPLVACRKAR